jgi:hypothetical protein
VYRIVSWHAIYYTRYDRVLLRNLFAGLLHLHRDVPRRSWALFLVLLSPVCGSCGHLQRLLAIILAYVGRFGRSAGRS